MRCFSMNQATHSSLPHAILNVKTTKLRELGVYELPDHRKFIVSTLYSDGCSLSPVWAWKHDGSAEYWVDVSGRLLDRGVPTQWRVQDLVDTGQTAAYPKPVLL